MPSNQNITQLEDLKGKVGRATSVVIVDYAKTSVKDQTTLRSKVREAGGEVLVAKNTLLDLAIGKGKLADSLQGMTAAIFAYSDPVSPIKALFEFHDKSDKLTIKQGYMDDSVLSPAQVEELSKLPSKFELLSKLAMILNGQATKLVQTLNGGSQKLVYALQAIADKKKSE